MKRLILLFLLLPLLSVPGRAEIRVTEVNFLESLGLDVNGAGPLLVKCDRAANRTILVNTYTSSITLIDDKDMSLVNIPIASRIPQYLKDEALALDERTGRVYIIGEKSLHVVDPVSRTSMTLATRSQFEMVAVDENTGNAFLVGRSDRQIGWFLYEKREIQYIPCFDRAEPMINLNATPPPPIRKAAVDESLNIALITDGYTHTLFTLCLDRGRILRKRPLDVKKGTRWHTAGYSDARHAFYVVIETDARKVVQAVRIDAADVMDIIVDLPEYSEGVGITYNAVTDEVIVPYDNHPNVHVISFARDGEISDIQVPAYGNDATALDETRNRLYVASWAYGEIDVIDLDTRTLVKRVKDAGILPHQFSMDLQPSAGRLYVPLGATAVNGSHGAAVTVFSLPDFTREKILTGWAPVAIAPLNEETCLVFNSEDAMAEVRADGSVIGHRLPVDYPRHTIVGPEDNLYLAYGPHQSYWPSVYIWAARNGILEIEPNAIETSGPFHMNFQYFDRRVPRLSQAMTVDKRGGLWMQQNNWGGENLFLAHFPEGIRQFQPMKRVEISERVLRETTQRVLRYDEETDRLYLVRIGETDSDPGRLLIIDAKTGGLIQSLNIGVTPADLVVDADHLYVSDFDDHTVTIVDKQTFAAEKLATDRQPLDLCLLEGNLWVISHGSNTLQQLKPLRKTFPIPFDGRPDLLQAFEGMLYITHHSDSFFRVLRFDPESGFFRKVLEKAYPYGETAFDTGNASFYTRGQFGDCLFRINAMHGDAKGRIWITDFLSGKLFIIEGE